ncbi:ABC-type bacteriocin/lantibiotic exporter with double-glycine peptidase domain [Oikeobacillus pervagus]|uniref:ABC-type bacteriocin/lantibiotic exporter with double-glycine peptidase domain n=1 Tax=Oikeobacillus pervagus TaxID=1325931 RepID=A0AAJ1WLM8_9BACI|nr:peptidase domain-containing ABC transporter [Oikeobacillus pervagus]MDQ0216376.1 ABC-type bacteriocin/lantibiotic exporter with double-glycine peptidase domain [Oikeobacillus pervagus]
MRRVPFIEQMEHSECGLASLCMILSFHGNHVPLSELRERYGVPKGGTSLFQIMEVGKSYHLNVKGYRASVDDLKNVLLPAIIHWENKHYVVLEKIGKKTAVIVDPALGRTKISLDEIEEKYSGFVLAMAPNESFEKKKGVSHTRFFLSFVLGKKPIIAFIVLTSLLIQGFALVIPWLTSWIIDQVIIPKNDGYLTAIGYSIVILLFSYLIFSALRGFLIAKLQTAIDKSLMTQFIDKLLNLTYGFFENRSTGELLFRANSNVYIRQILSTKAITFLIDGILLITYLVVMAQYSLKMTGIVLVIGISIFGILVFSTSVSRKLADKEISAQSQVQRILSESINGISDVKVMGLENQVYNDWFKKFSLQLMHAEKRSIWTSLINTIATSVQFILPIYLLWLSGKPIISGSMTLGDVLGFNALALSFITPIISIGNGYGELIYLGSYIQRIYDVMHAKTERENGQSVFSSPIKGKVEFKNVSYKHNHFSDHTVKNISFKVKPGERVAIVGSSGAGKSTLVKLLLGLYTPSEGSILFDGMESNKFNLRFLRKSIGVVFQEARLFNKTIAENIASERQDVTDKDILKAAYQANIHEEIMQLPLQYATTVSEFGINFSGGQRQRLILARALASKPSILLLDEATSALDTLSEKIIDEHLSELPCTQIIIAHRLSTIKNADRIVVMHQGEIVETGTHDELLDQQGYYYKLTKTQQIKEKNYEKVAL